MKALIFAAGLGTRLRPLTDTMPKALVPVNGEPLLKHLILRLKDAGYDDIVVNVHHFAGQIKAYLASEDFGVKLGISDESGQLMDTGGGVLFAEKLLRGEGSFLAHNVDIFSNISFEALREAARKEALATLVASERETARYLLVDDSGRLVGWTNVKTSQLRSPYPGLDPRKYRHLAFAGIHLLSDRIFDAMRSCGLSGAFPIMDFYLDHCDKFPVYVHVPENFRVLDVGKTESLAEAETLLKAL